MRDEEVEHRHAYGGLPGDRDVMRVAAELCDVPFDPAQGARLVHQAVVAGRTAATRRERRMGEEPERAKSVVDRHHDARPRRACSRRSYGRHPR